MQAQTSGLTPMHIVDVVYYWARSAPLRPAFIETSGVVTYATLANGIELAAEHFAANIEDRSQPVALCIASGSKMLIALLGLLRAGFDVVLSGTNVFKELKPLGTTTLVYERDIPTLDGGQNIMFDDNWLHFGFAVKKRKPLRSGSAQGRNILCFTSGTTGRPKLVICPQKSWQERVLFPVNSAFFSYERILIVPSLLTSWGLSRAYEALHSGRTVCAGPPLVATLWLVNTYDVDTILASPQQAVELAAHQEKDKRFPLKSLKALHIGAASISRDAAHRIQQNLCRNIVMIYGSTEAGVAAVAPYDMIADIPGAVGFIVPGAHVEIVDGAGSPLPAGREGFVRVRSAVLAENTAASGSRDEWFYTGDFGWITEDRLLCIAGRTGDVVNRGGEKLLIPDIENWLRTCAGVQDAGVCTVPGPSGFSEIWVGLVLSPTADFAATRFTIEANAFYKSNIDKVFLVESIPRGTLGKIQRDELKKKLQETAADQAKSS
jgi:acyl-coenzyme A synthetase/AMP-(fatty) acid ligase